MILRPLPVKLKNPKAEKMKPYHKTFSIYNAKIVTGDDIIDGGSIVIESGKIARMSRDRIITGENPFDAGNNYLMPGFIDMHSDSIEKEIESRPGTYLATNIALFELDKKLASAGVTTIYHSVSFADEVIIVIRSLDVVESIIREIKRLKDELLLKTLVHARFEITHTGGLDVIERLVNERMIDLISIMDHTPGQGQFKTESQIKGYYGDRFGVNSESIKNLIETRMSVREEHGLNNAVKMMTIARDNNIPIASHDDDTHEKVINLKQNGSIISEFPVSMEAVKAAHENGLYIALGSPNILRGYSHNRNLSARDLIAAGYGNIVCSDYIPSTLVHALFILVDKGIKSITEAVKMFSGNPASALGLSDMTGSIREGLDADLIVVRNDKEVPRIQKTYVAGREAYSACMD
jgi:alpha-D-ribose 1-methylphosphonate 5-triphosphate diphosphatase